MSTWGGRRISTLKAKVIERYGMTCWLCQREIRPDQFSIDHIHPRSKGGNDDIDNLRPAHLICNKRRGVKDPRGFRPIPNPSRSW